MSVKLYTSDSRSGSEPHSAALVLINGLSRVMPSHDMSAPAASLGIVHRTNLWTEGDREQESVGWEWLGTRELRAPIMFLSVCCLSICLFVCALLCVPLSECLTACVITAASECLTACATCGRFRSCCRCQSQLPHHSPRCHLHSLVHT